MPPAQQREVENQRRTAIRPMLEMVTLRPGHRPIAARKSQCLSRAISRKFTAKLDFGHRACRIAPRPSVTPSSESLWAAATPHRRGRCAAGAASPHGGEVKTDLNRRPWITPGPNPTSFFPVLLGCYIPPPPRPLRGRGRLPTRWGGEKQTSPDAPGSLPAPNPTSFFPVLSGAAAPHRRGRCAVGAASPHGGEVKTDLT